MWASTYMNLHKGIPTDTAAKFGSLFFIGITIGRAISGFMTMKLSDREMIRLGQGFILLALMVVMHDTLNKVTDYNPRVNTEKQTETSAGEEKFL